MRRNWNSPWLVLAAVLLAANPAEGAGPPDVSVTTSGPVQEVVETSTQAWKSCPDDNIIDCTGKPIHYLQVTTPSASGTYTVVVTATLQFRTTPGDIAFVGTKSGMSPPLEIMSPGLYTLSSEGVLQVASLEWSETGLSPNTTYSVALGGEAKLKSGNKAAFLRIARRVVTVKVLYSP